MRTAFDNMRHELCMKTKSRTEQALDFHKQKPWSQLLTKTNICINVAQPRKVNWRWWETNHLVEKQWFNSNLAVWLWMRSIELTAVNRGAFMSLYLPGFSIWWNRLFLSLAPASPVITPHKEGSLSPDWSHIYGVASTSAFLPWWSIQ